MTKALRFPVALVPFGLLLLTEDFSLPHLSNISNSQINFRMDVSTEMAKHYYSRFDFRSPAVYINEGWKSGDVIILSGVIPVSFYLIPSPYIYYDQSSLQFRKNARRQGTKERWGFPLLNSRKTIEKVVRPSRTTWIVTRIDRNPIVENVQLTEWVKNSYKHVPVDVTIDSPGIDQRIQVIKVTPHIS